MENFKRALRLFGLAILISMAAMGLMFGPIFTSKEKYHDNEIRIELAEKREDEEGELKDVT